MSVIDPNIRIFILKNYPDPQMFMANLYDVYGYNILSVKTYKNFPLCKLKQFQSTDNCSSCRKNSGACSPCSSGCFQSCRNNIFTITQGEFTESPYCLLTVIIAKKAKRCYSCRYNVFKDCNCAQQIPYCLNDKFIDWMSFYNPGYYSFLRFNYPHPNKYIGLEKYYKI